MEPLMWLAVPAMKLLAMPTSQFNDKQVIDTYNRLKWWLSDIGKMVS